LKQLKEHMQMEYEDLLSKAAILMDRNEMNKIKIAQEELENRKLKVKVYNFENQMMENEATIEKMRAHEKQLEQNQIYLEEAGFDKDRVIKQHQGLVKELSGRIEKLRKD